MLLPAHWKSKLQQLLTGICHIKWWCLYPSNQNSDDSGLITSVWLVWFIFPSQSHWKIWNSWFLLPRAAARCMFCCPCWLQVSTAPMLLLLKLWFQQDIRNPNSLLICLHLFSQDRLICHFILSTQNFLFNIVLWSTSFYFAVVTQFKSAITLFSILHFSLFIIFLPFVLSLRWRFMVSCEVAI